MRATLHRRSVRLTGTVAAVSGLSGDVAYAVRTRLAALLVLVCIAALAFGPSALAATASVDSTNGVLTYVAGPGEANDLTMARPAGGVFSRSVHVTDRGAAILAGSGCQSVRAHEVLCIGAVSVDVRVGDLDDSATVSGTLDEAATVTKFDVDALIPATISGGDGADVITGSDAPDALRGDSGDDTLAGLDGWVWVPVGDGDPGARQERDELEGGAGSDSLFGGPGPDSLVGGPGADSLSGGDDDGGPGFDNDQVSYEQDSGPVVVTVDGLAGDGAQGENDNVRSDIESVVGTELDDRLIAGAQATALQGLAGNDTLRGGPSRDGLSGDAGDDDIAGGAGDDYIAGDRGSDALRGNGGRDDIDGGPGEDLIDGGAGREWASGDGGDDVLRGDVGADVLLGDAGDDVIGGGPGRDRLHGDPGRDRLNGGAGDDFVAGGPNDDRLTGAHGRDRLDGDFSWDYAGRGNDTIAGGPGDDRLTGRRGRDELLAGSGADRLNARDGARDLVVGGAGRDSACVDRALDAVRAVETQRCRGSSPRLAGSRRPR